ncbi:MAG: MAPEG family protein [Pseudomonadales bacterium]|nr:MAPEG family protein [Pseudomonadales bacterium]
MIFPITALYAALLAVIGLVLMFHVIAMRGKTGISILHGDDMQLAQAMRRHGNFVETVPLALILMGIVEANGGNTVLLHVIGAVLMIARIAQPLGLHHDRMIHPLRAVGTVGTVLPTVVLIGVALWQVTGW